MVKRVQQVMYNMIVITDIDNKVFDYIDTWSENLSHIAWEIRASYHLTVVSTPGQYVYGRCIIFNLAPYIYCWDITDRKKRQFDIDNVCENAKRSIFDYAVGDLVYVYKIGVYQKLLYKNHGSIK